MANPISPQALAEQAKRAYQAGDFLLAAQAFSDAAGLYEKAGDTPMSAEMKNNQSVALLRARQPQAALEAALGTETVFLKTGDNRRRGMALANQASALEALKRFKDAMDCYKDAGDALQEAQEGDLRAEVMQLLSMLYLRRFKFYDAVIALQSGLAGVTHPTPRQRWMKKILSIHL